MAKVIKRCVEVAQWRKYSVITLSTADDGSVAVQPISSRGNDLRHHPSIIEAHAALTLPDFPLISMLWLPLPLYLSVAAHILWTPQ